MVCQVIRHKDTNEILEVKADNNKPSNLYREILQEIPDKESALEEWLFAYTEEFEEWKNRNKARVVVDENQEPNYQSIKYFKEDFIRELRAKKEAAKKIEHDLLDLFDRDQELANSVYSKIFHNPEISPEKLLEELENEGIIEKDCTGGKL